MNCRKCGVKLNYKPYGELSKTTVAKMADDHGSKEGCDFPAANVELVLKTLRTMKALGKE